MLPSSQLLLENVTSTGCRFDDFFVTSLVDKGGEVVVTVPSFLEVNGWEAGESPAILPCTLSWTETAATF